MLQHKRQNLHRSRWPSPGTTGRFVSHCALPDSADCRYRIGIHTVWIRFLDNGELARFSGIWFE